jgi:hypothetical protein
MDYFTAPTRSAWSGPLDYSAGEADKSTIAKATIKAITIRMAGTLLFRSASCRR